jgi:hypothetical protein
MLAGQLGRLAGVLKKLRRRHGRIDFVKAVPKTGEIRDFGHWNCWRRKRAKKSWARELRIASTGDGQHPQTLTAGPSDRAMRFYR